MLASGAGRVVAIAGPAPVQRHLLVRDPRAPDTDAIIAEADTAAIARSCRTNTQSDSRVLVPHRDERGVAPAHFHDPGSLEGTANRLARHLDVPGRDAFQGRRRGHEPQPQLAVGVPAPRVHLAAITAKGLSDDARGTKPPLSRRDAVALGVDVRQVAHQRVEGLGCCDGPRVEVACGNREKVESRERFEAGWPRHVGRLVVWRCQLRI
mmetsp:Transcript_8497/g.21085  ORF Transcript_8497/g.21085 Transcript_8497/m.21085 type:complete len:209 (-) Transcript_8497:4029-4655(-)